MLIWATIASRPRMVEVFGQRLEVVDNQEDVAVWVVGHRAGFAAELAAAELLDAVDPALRKLRWRAASSLIALDTVRRMPSSSSA